MPIRLPAICDYHQTRSPLEKGLLAGIISHGLSSATTNCASSRHSILRLWRGPSPRAYSRGLSHMGFHPLRRIVPLRGTPSCAFGAALLQGPTRGGLSHMGFHTAAANCASSRHCNPLPLARPFFKGLRAGIISHRLSCRCDELCLFEALQSSPFGAALLQGPSQMGGIS